MSGAARIVDFDVAYDNSGAVADAAAYREKWPILAGAFRERLAARGRAELDIAYGEGDRQRYDLFLPEGEPRGLAVFIHGGYWKAFDKSVFSHLANGPVERGFAVAVPSYTLCPNARIEVIGTEIARFLQRVAVRIGGPILLSGHSAGGHLATRIACADAPLSDETRERIAAIVSISGVHDLRPLLRTRMNDILRLDAPEARNESPALLEPAVDAPITAWVGGAELPEFRRQSALLVSSWHGLGARTELVEAAGRHHFDVVEDLAEPGSPLVRLLTEASPA